MKLSTILFIGLVINASMTCYAASTPYDCGAISNDDKRLSCYDGFFKNKPYDTNTTIAAPVAQAKPQPPKADDSFGKELIQSERDASPESIRSRAIGDFKNWRENMTIRLENGQSWKISARANVFYKTSNPNVEITKGMLGTYYMTVEGINNRFKVRRTQ